MQEIEFQAFINSFAISSSVSNFSCDCTKVIGKKENWKLGCDNLENSKKFLTF